jgi:hypothetical protein
MCGTDKFIGIVNAGKKIVIEATKQAVDEGLIEPVFVGEKTIIEKHAIDLIMIEVHHYDEKTIKMAKEILDLLTKKNFKLIFGTYPGNCIFKQSL